MIEQLSADLSRLFENRELAKDCAFLRRVALNIQHSYFEAKKSQKAAIILFLQQPVGHFMQNSHTLLAASHHFSEQDPRYSDLSELLEEIADFGPLFIQLPHGRAGS